MKVGAKLGLFGSWYATLDGQIHICQHWHRTSKGAEKCGKQLARFLDKVEKIKKERGLK